MSAAVRCGDLIFLAGVTADRETHKTIEEQASNIFAKLEERLALAGSDKSHMASAMIFLKDMALFDRFNAVWDAWVDQENLPARTCVHAQLAHEEVLVEITVFAFAKDI